MAIRAIAGDFVVSSNRIMDNDYSSVTALANGGFAVAWEWGAGTVRDIHYQNFSATGGRTGALGVIDSATDETPAIAQLSNGSLAILWHRSETLAPEDNGVFGAIVSSGGNLGSAFQVNVRTGNVQDRPEVFARPDGSFVATWTSGDADIGDIRARIFSANGTSTRLEILVNPTPFTQVEQSAARLADGSFVVTWFSYTDPLDFAGELRGRVFNANGVPTTEQFEINDGNAPTRDVEVAALANGGFATIYSGPDYLTARTFAADGSPTSGEMRVAKFPGLASEMAVAKLADNTFVAVWVSPDNGDGSGNCIRARQLDAGGKPSGAEIIVNSTRTGDQLEPDVAALKGGGFVVTWSDFDETNGGMPIVRARVFDVDKPRQGTDGPDAFPGTTGADTYDGLGGNDRINGAAGNDTLTGGLGNDTIDGGAGSDRMVGGAGNDVYRVDNLLDTVDEAAGSGRDKVIATVSWSLAASPRVSGVVEDLVLAGNVAINGAGNAAANVVTGNAAANRLDGAAGNDTLNGGAGNDVLIGGAGADALTGGLGSDVFRFGTPLAGGVDRIADFDVAADTIQLDNAVMAALGARTGPLAEAMFWKSAAGVAHDADDRIVYDTDTGRLFYDSNGNAAGGVQQIAALKPSLALTHLDFTVI